MESEYLYRVILLGILTLLWHNSPVCCQDNPTEPAQNASARFLRHYGYMEGQRRDSRSRSAPPADMPGAIRRFQHFVGIRETGVLDAPTVQKMAEPRCGNSDLELRITVRRKKRYVLNRSKWHKRDLTYKLLPDRTTSKVSAPVVDNLLEEAFGMWSAVTNLRFTNKRQGRADIVLLFARRQHGDNYPFDGPGKALAHAFAPAGGGDIHFDEDEPWSPSSSGGRNLLAVAVHEIGHSLGLSHSEDKQAIMYPYYRAGVTRLYSDDIRGIQSLYGKPVSTSSTTTTTTTTTPTTTTTRTRPKTTLVPRKTTFWRPWRTYRPATTRGWFCWWCVSARPARPTTRYPRIFGASYPATDVDVAFPTRPKTTPTTTTELPTESSTETSTRRTLNGDNTEFCRLGDIEAIISPPDSRFIYAFRENRFVKMDDNGLMEGYPRYTALNFLGISWVDAAMVVRDRQREPIIYLFSSNWVAKYHLNFTQIGGYTPISEEFPDLNVGSIDAAVQWSGNNKIYLFEGNQYYKIGANKRIENGYPRSISIWGLPPSVQRINAATTWSKNRELYFFVQDKYYKYDARRGRLAESTSGPPYPRSTARWWFGCTN